MIRCFWEPVFGATLISCYLIKSLSVAFFKWPCRAADRRRDI